jgi:hypothetical protein
MTFAQYGINDWIHPVNNSAEIDSNNNIHLYSNSHILLIDFTDSLNIFEHKNGLEYNKRVRNGIFKLKFSRKQIVTKIVESEYSLNIHNNFNEFIIGYTRTKGMLGVDLNLKKYSRMTQLFPSVQFSAKLHPNLKFILGKSIYSHPLNLTMSYTDFKYIMNNVHTNHEHYHYGLKFNGDKYSINFTLEDDDFEIYPSSANVKIHTGNKNKSVLNGTVLLTKNHKINWYYYKKHFQLGLDLYNNSNESFFTINKYENKNSMYSLGYQFLLKKYVVNIDLCKRDMDFLFSNRSRPGLTNMDIEALFNNALFVNNLDIGKIDQISCSVRFSNNSSLIFSHAFQIDWLIDHYDIDMKTNGWALGIPIPNYVYDQNQKIIGKKAVNIRLEMVGKFNQWSLSVSFSQHIPYKIITTDEIYTPSDYTETDSRKEEIYGGGLMKVSLIRYLD